MKRINVNGVELCVEAFGHAEDAPVLLIGVTMLSWPDELCAALAGRYVVRYDLRDLVTDASELVARPQPDWTDRDSVVDHMTGSARLMSGSGGFDEQDARAAAGAIFDRAGHTATAQAASHLGTMFAAIDFRPRWRERLGDITAPTLVVHGDGDPFFPHGNRVVTDRRHDPASGNRRRFS